MTAERDGLSRTIWNAVYDSRRPWAAQTLSSGGGTWTFSLAFDMTTVVDPNGGAWEYGRDSSGRVKYVKDPAGQVTSYEFDSEGRLASITRPLGDRTVYEYASELSNGDRRPMASVTSITEVPRAGTGERVANITRVTRIEYGPANLPRSITTPDGAATIILRDPRGNPLEMIDASGLKTVTTYDERGQLVKSSDPRAGTTTFQYEPNGVKKGHLKSVSTPAGTTTVSTDNRGNTQRITDARGRTVTYTYNKLDQLETESRGGSRTLNTYDAARNLVSRQVLAGPDGSGNPTYSISTIATDEVGRVRTQNNNGRLSATHYDAAGNVIRLEGPGTSPVVYGYDSRGRIDTLTIGGRTTNHAYDDNGQPSTVRDPRGNTTTFLTGGFGQTIGQVDASGITIGTTTDAANRPIDERVIKADAQGKTFILRWVTREYDAIGRMIKESRKLFKDPLEIPANGTDPTGATDIVSRWIYDDVGRKITSIDPNGNQTVTEMDDLGRPSRTVDAMGNESLVTYNENGTRESEALIGLAPDGTRSSFRTVYEYDDQNRLIVISDVSAEARPLMTRFEYDVRGNRTAVIDPDGHETKFEFDLQGRLAKTVDGEGGETIRTYDDADRLVSLTDANGNETVWTWGVDGNLESERRADGATWRYTYDENHNVKTVIDPNGTITTFAYDSLDRLIGKRIEKAANIGGPSDVKLGLDDLGRVIATETNEGVREMFIYDSLDRQLSESVHITGSLGREVSKKYDAASNIVELTYPSGLVLTKSYDGLHRLARIGTSSDATPIASYSDIGHRQSSKHLSNGLVQTWKHDPNANLTAILTSVGTEPPIANIAYERALSGYKSAVIRPDLNRRSSFTLDRTGAITNETVARTDTETSSLIASTDYLLDRNLNYRSVIRNTYTPVARGMTTTDTLLNSRNQYTLYGRERPSWDPNGNLRALSTATMRYDADNRLTRAQTPDGRVVDILYSGSGRKVREKTATGAATKTTDYVPESDRVIEEYVGDGQLAARYVHGRGIDEIVWAEVGRTNLFPVQDELGNVERLTDSAGATLERYEYESYGKFRVFTSAAPTGWKWLFQGREYNGALANYDFRARTLWPEFGRFGQEDASGPADHPNLYQGLLGNWTANADPSGEVVVMMHGINDSGENWAAGVAQALGEEWDAHGADAGQDVVNLVNRQWTGPFLGSCKPAMGEFCADNAYNALRHGYLDSDTLNAGKRTRQALAQLRTQLNGSRWRRGEPIQALAHSHGTAMLLAAARQNGKDGERFALSNVILVGSDLHRSININALLESAGTVYNFYSPFDEAVGPLRGAGAVGFDTDRTGIPTFITAPRRGKLIQKPASGTRHAGDVNVTTSGKVPWMSRKLATERYASILAITKARPQPDSQPWVDAYKVFRQSLGLGWTVDLPPYFFQKYPRR